VFRNIEPETLGRKARCGCGTVFRLGKKSDKQDPADLMDVDLLGEDMLGSEMAHSNPVPIQSEPTKRKRASSRRSKTNTGASSSGKNSDSRKNSAAKSKRRKPNKSRTKSQVALPPSDTEEQGNPILEPIPDPPVPQVSLTVQTTEPRSRPPRQQEPIFDQTYGDLDDILEGAGDAKPVVVRPRPEPEVDSSTKKMNGQTESKLANSKSITSKLTASTIGFLAALLSATLAFWFGLFVASSRFQIINWLLLDRFSVHLHSVYHAIFGESEISSGYALLFQSVGWILWSLAFAMILIAVGQFVNAFFKLITQRQVVPWTDGLAAASGVAVVFLLLGIVFCQSSFAKQEHRTLDAYEQPVVEEGEHLANVTRIREVIDQRDRSFTTTMLVACSVPMLVFIFSMVRLFTKNLEKKPLASTV
jgi:hypothetical protein